MTVAVSTLRRGRSRLRAVAGTLALLFAGLILSTAAPAAAQVPADLDGGAKCRGSFVNPITDVCWDCLFPLSLGSVKLAGGPPDFGNPGSPICACADPIPRIGLAIGFWEPARMADVTKQAWCFPSLGGMSLDPGFGFGNKGVANSGRRGDNAEYHVHYYAYPLLYMLQLLSSALCLEADSFDLAYVSELDPLWGNDALTTILNPEALLFATPVAKAACTADCVAATSGVPIRETFWCLGCQTQTYPMNGNVSNSHSPVQSSVAAAERMTFKMHRYGVAWQTSTSAALCQAKPQPVMDKRQYRYQLTNPVAHTSGPGKCPRVGGSSILYDAGKVPPHKDDLSYLIWRKRNCCAL